MYCTDCLNWINISLEKIRIRFNCETIPSWILHNPLKIHALQQERIFAQTKRTKHAFAILIMIFVVIDLINVIRVEVKRLYLHRASERCARDEIRKKGVCVCDRNIHRHRVQQGMRWWCGSAPRSGEKS